MRSGPESPFWKIKGMSVVDNLGDYADVPVLHITGWYDSWTRQVTMNYQALFRAKSSPQRLTIGPWTHGGQTSRTAGEVEFTPDAAIDLRAYRLRWYDRWLKGERNGADDDLPVWIYVMGTGDDRRSPGDKLLHGGTWRGEKEWPLSRPRSPPITSEPTADSRPGRPPSPIARRPTRSTPRIRSRRSGATSPQTSS